jgi:hypothetical protein
MPVFTVIKARKKSRIVDAYQLAEILRRDCDHIFVEVAQTRRNQAVQAVAKTFTNYGALLGAIAAIGIPLTHVDAGQWKDALKVSAEKDHARGRASELIPSGAVHWPLKKHHGRAESALIALFGSRSLNQMAA